MLIDKHIWQKTTPTAQFHLPGPFGLFPCILVGGVMKAMGFLNRSV